MAAKISATPRSLRSITNVYSYLLSEPSALSADSSHPLEVSPETYYLSEGAYVNFRNKLLHVEGQVLNALGFNTHVALPHPLAITYLQTLGVFGSQDGKSIGKEVAKRAIEHLNTALLSPQMLYLTHQPCALATAAIYLAAREQGVKLPEVEWWEVFDCDREELGFLVLGMGSLESVARRERKRWGEKGMITRSDIRNELNVMGYKYGVEVEDEEAEMARLLDQKVADA